MLADTNDVNDSNPEPSEAHNPSHITFHSFESCVICLDGIIEKAVALPCQHDKFDFPCLLTWTQHQQVCPLCKTNVTGIRYGNEYILTLPPPQSEPTRASNRNTAANNHESRPAAYLSNRRNRHSLIRTHPEDHDHDRDRDQEKALTFRRRVYLHGMYSLYVGNNRISRYKNITPQSFVDETLVSRARTFIRRELRVFQYLDPSPPESDSSEGVTRSNDRRASNAEFLLEYIVCVLKSVDVKDCSGAAEDLVGEFLGRRDARLFLHELLNWLRSPCVRLSEWDRHVQYAQDMR